MMSKEETPPADAGRGLSEGLGPTPRERACTCHPSDNPPRPCPGMHALGACFEADNQRLRAAALGVVVHMEGRMPVRGWLKDNVKSREALAELVRVLGA